MATVVRSFADQKSWITGFIPWRFRRFMARDSSETGLPSLPQGGVDPGEVRVRLRRAFLGTSVRYFRSGC